MKKNKLLSFAAFVCMLFGFSVAQAQCFTPAYPTGNMILDPGFDSTTLSKGGYSGWGPTAISTSATATYCGGRSAYIRGNCWPDGGSIDRTLSTGNGNALKVLTKYRIRAMVNSKATAGKSFQFEVEGVNGGAGVKFQLPNTNGWKQIDTTFITGATVVTGKGIYFNSCTNAPLITDTCFIDNYEMYMVPKIYTSPASLTFLGLSSKKVVVRAEKLSQDIAITASEGFTVAPVSMLSTVSGSTSDSLTVTFNSATSKSGYVYFTSGSVKDSLQVTGTLDPSILANKTSLSFDELNPKDSIIVTGGNLTDDITITAPSGITVNPTTISKTSATNIKVIVTYDGTTSNVTGDIVLTSSGTSKNVSVVATKNSDCFTPLYPTGNLIADTYCNSYLTDGWGSKSINADPLYVYCGARSGKIDGGSIDRKLNGTNGNAQMLANTNYRVKAKVYKVSGGIQIGVYGWSSSSGDINHLATTTNAWEDIDFTFTSGATLGGSQGIFFNGGTGYIDNWEMYNLTLITAVKTTSGLSKPSVYMKENAIVTDFELTQSSNVEISVFNAQGMLLNKTIGSFNEGKNSKVVDVNLVSGLYLVKLTQNGKSITAKVIK